MSLPLRGRSDHARGAGVRRVCVVCEFPRPALNEGLRAPPLRRPPFAPRREAAQPPRDARVLGRGGPAPQVTALPPPRANVPGRLEKGKAGEGSAARGTDHASRSRFLPPLVQAPVSPPPPPPPATAPPPGPRPQPIAARRERLRPGAGLAQAWRACALPTAPRREEKEEEVVEEEEAARGNREASRSAGRESESSRAAAASPPSARAPAGGPPQRARACLGVRP